MHRECRERFPRHRLQRKPLVSDPGMHHSMCVTHVLGCTSGSLTRGGRENVPGIPGACATHTCRYLIRGLWWPLHKWHPHKNNGLPSHDLLALCCTALWWCFLNVIPIWCNINVKYIAPKPEFKFKYAVWQWAATKPWIWAPENRDLQNPI